VDEDRHPETVAGFRVIRRLATGGTSDVLLARAEGPHGFERVVVLKLLLDRHRNDPAFERMFAREAAAYARLNHPAIVKLYDFFASGDQLVMVLEFVDGMPLNRLRALMRVAGEVMDDRACVYLASCVFAALAAAHSARDPETGAFAPVIHRDVNPSNVLLPWDGHVKLADFGIAKVTGLTGDTKIGLIKGTFGYMSPEQVRGEEVSVRADVYAASLLFWELLARRRAIQHSALPEIEVLRAMAHPSIVSLDVLRPELPAAVRNIVRRGLEPIADRRDLTAEEVLKTLRATVPLEQGRQALIEALRRIRPRSEAEMAVTADGSIAPPSAAGSLPPGTQAPITDAMPGPPQLPDGFMPTSESEMQTSIQLDPLSEEGPTAMPLGVTPSPVGARVTSPLAPAAGQVKQPPRPAPVARRATPPPRPAVVVPRAEHAERPGPPPDMDARPSPPVDRTLASPRALPDVFAPRAVPPVEVTAPPPQKAFTSTIPMGQDPDGRARHVAPTQKGFASTLPLDLAPRTVADPPVDPAFGAATSPLAESARPLPSIAGRFPSPPTPMEAADPLETPESVQTIKGGFSVPTGTPGAMLVDGGIVPEMLGSPVTARLTPSPAAGAPPPEPRGALAGAAVPSTVRMAGAPDPALGYASSEPAFEPVAVAPSWYSPPAPVGSPYGLATPETRAPFDVVDQRRGRVWVLLAVVFVLLCGSALAAVLIRARAYDQALAVASASARAPVAPGSQASVAALASAPHVSRPPSSGVTLVASGAPSASAAPSASVAAAEATSAAEASSAGPAAVAVASPATAPRDPESASATTKPGGDTAASAPASAGPTPGPTTGLVRTGSSAHQHRVYVDGKLAGEGETAILVACGKRTVQIGSHGTPQDVDVPCNGEVTVK